MVKGSDAMYPSVYYNPGMSDEQRPGMVKASVNVTRHWSNYSGHPNKPIYMYTASFMKFDDGGLPVYYDDVRLVYINIVKDIGSTSQRRPFSF